MGSAARSLAKAEQLPQGDIVRILLEQHARIGELCAAVASATDKARRGDSFDELRALLAVHESAEELVVRPRTRIIAGAGTADQRSAEEKVVARTLTELEGLGVDTADFETKFANFAQSVAEHAEAEETEEFDWLVDVCNETERGRLGAMLLQAERLASKHPLTTLAGSSVTRWSARPFASLLDHAQEILGRVTRAP